MHGTPSVELPSMCCLTTVSCMMIQFQLEAPLKQEGVDSEEATR